MLVIVVGLALLVTMAITLVAQNEALADKLAVSSYIFLISGVVYLLIRQIKGSDGYNDG